MKVFHERAAVQVQNIPHINSVTLEITLKCWRRNVS